MNNRLKKKIEVQELKFREFMQMKGVEVVPACVELERIADENDGQITAANVLDAARDVANPLHNAFEWDDSVAAENHRLWQARMLIKSIRVVYEDRPEEPKFVHVRVNNSGYYAAASVVVRDVDEWEQARKAVEDQIGRTRRCVEDFLRIARAAGRDDEARDIMRGMMGSLL